VHDQLTTLANESPTSIFPDTGAGVDDVRDKLPLLWIRAGPSSFDETVISLSNPFDRRDYDS